MSERNRIATGLSREKLEEFVQRCAKTPNLTLKCIAKLAAEYGLEISLRTAKAFRDTTFERVRGELQGRLAKAEQLPGLCPPETQDHFLKAAKALVAESVFARVAKAGPDDKLDLDGLSKTVKRLEDAALRESAQAESVRVQRLNCMARLLAVRERLSKSEETMDEPFAARFDRLCATHFDEEKIAQLDSASTTVTGPTSLDHLAAKVQMYFNLSLDRAVQRMAPRKGTLFSVAAAKEAEEAEAAAAKETAEAGGPAAQKAAEARASVAREAAEWEAAAAALEAFKDFDLGAAPSAEEPAG